MRIYLRLSKPQQEHTHTDTLHSEILWCMTNHIFTSVCIHVWEFSQITVFSSKLPVKCNWGPTETVLNAPYGKFFCVPHMAPAAGYKNILFYARYEISTCSQ